MRDAQANDTVARFFDQQAAASYDQRQSRLAPITENLHFLISLVLKDLPDQARILCVGVGTGAEIVKLANAYPGWTFTGIDPSADMLKKCSARVEHNQLASRVELFHGYLPDLPQSEPYDAVLCLLVTHFLKDRDDRRRMFQDMGRRLKSNGYLINADISGDLNAPEFPNLLEKWKTMSMLAGSTAEQVAKISQTWKEHISVLPPGQIEELIRQAGFSMPVIFFQSLFICAWYSRKD